MDLDTCEEAVTHSLIPTNQRPKQPTNDPNNLPNLPNPTPTYTQQPTQPTQPQTNRHQTTTIMARYEGSLSIGSLGYKAADAGKVCGAIIGRGGQGIKAISSKFPGLYINVYDSRNGMDARAAPRDCDTIHLTGRSTADLSLIHI